MSGPEYPKKFEPGSNAIGLFKIGVSPIGTIPWFDFWKTVISQYGNSDRLTSLLGSVNIVDPTENFDAFYDWIWNVKTARGYGLDVWGRIVGVGRVLQVPIGQYFGFAEAGITASPFNQDSFYNGEVLTNNYSLTDDAYRKLIYAKALANISDSSIPTINRILRILFPNRGNCYCTDGQNMTMTYTFKFVLTSVEKAIVSQTGVLPKPAGVALSFSYLG